MDSFLSLFSFLFPLSTFSFSSFSSLSSLFSPFLFFFRLLVLLFLPCLAQPICYSLKPLTHYSTVRVSSLDTAEHVLRDVMCEAGMWVATHNLACRLSKPLFSNLRADRSKLARCGLLSVAHLHDRCRYGEDKNGERKSGEVERVSTLERCAKTTSRGHTQREALI